MDTCQACSRSLNSGKKITCSGSCGLLFHQTCVGLMKLHYSAWSARVGLLWFCNSCRLNFNPAVYNREKNIMEALRELLIRMDSMDTRLGNYGENLRTFNKSLYGPQHDRSTFLQNIDLLNLDDTIDHINRRFNEHIGITTAKGFSMLGFIRRHASVFTDVYVLKTLYCTLVRSILEYTSPIWNPYYVVHILSVERVQKKFLRFALRMLPWNDPNNLPPYSERRRLIGLESWSARHTKIQQIFIFDVVEGVIEQIPLNIPPQCFRNFNLLAVPYHRTNFDVCIRAFSGFPRSLILTCQEVSLEPGLVKL